MTETIMPAFGRFKEQGIIIGCLLAGYGELEFELCRCVSAVTTDWDAAVRAMFKDRGELRRIQTAKALIGDAYINVGLAREYLHALADLDWCRQIRNQYAHCGWYDSSAEGVCIYDLETLAKDPTPIIFVTMKRFPVDLPLLQHQEEFFKYVQKCFWFLDCKYCTLAARPPNHQHSMPSVVARPRKHN